jgi:DNA-binding response OmpR family regulator
MPKQIIVIEDEPAIRNMVADVLADEGYLVRTAATIEAGLALLPAFRPHLILCDLLLPPRTGREFYNRLIKDPLVADLPIVFMTALLPGDADNRLIGDIQHVPVIYKPINIPELLTVVEMFIA